MVNPDGFVVHPITQFYYHALIVKKLDIDSVVGRMDAAFLAPGGKYYVVCLSTGVTELAVEQQENK